MAPKKGGNGGGKKGYKRKSLPARRSPSIGKFHVESGESMSPNHTKLSPTDVKMGLNNTNLSLNWTHMSMRDSKFLSPGRCYPYPF